MTREKGADLEATANLKIYRHKESQSRVEGGSGDKDEENPLHHVYRYGRPA